MLIIIASHLAQHGGFNFPADSISVNKIWWQFMSTCGGRGNDLFVLLSGYFLIKSSGINFHKLFRLWVKTEFYSVIVFCCMVYSGLEVLTFKTAVISLLPVTHGWWWFPRIYFVMYLIHPYLNILLHSFTRKDYEKFLMTVMIYWCLIPAFLRSDFGGSPLIDFICIYSIAGYFRLWAEDFGSSKFILYGLLFTLADIFGAAFFDFTGLYNSYLGSMAMSFAGMMKPFTLLSALCFLLGFRKLSVSTDKFINAAAGATFGVYMLHENEFNIAKLWRNTLHACSFQDSPYLIAYTIVVVIVVYVVCTVIELLRAKAFRTLSGGRLS